MTSKKVKVFVIIAIALIVVITATWFFKYSTVGFTPDQAVKVSQSEVPLDHVETEDFHFYFCQMDVKYLEFRTSIIAVEKKGLLYEVVDEPTLYTLYNEGEAVGYLQTYCKGDRYYNCISSSAVGSSELMYTDEVIIEGERHEVKNGLYFVTDSIVTEFNVGENVVMVGIN